MTADEATAIILEAIGRVAPEIDPTSIDPGGELQLEADLDSMDFLHVVEAVSTVIGRDIAERVYPQIATLEGFTQYLVENSAS